MRGEALGKKTKMQKEDRGKFSIQDDAKHGGIKCLISTGIRKKERIWY